MPVNRRGIASVVAIGEFDNDAIGVQEPSSQELSRFANAKSGRPVWRKRHCKFGARHAIFGPTAC